MGWGGNGWIGTVRSWTNPVVLGAGRGLVKVYYAVGCSIRLRRFCSADNLVEPVMDNAHEYVAEQNLFLLPKDK